jgi:hypothetical protein
VQIERYIRLESPITIVRDRMAEVRWNSPVILLIAIAGIVLISAIASVKIFEGELLVAVGIVLAMLMLPLMLKSLSHPEWLVALYALIFGFYPRARLSFGSMPIYFIDVILGVVLVIMALRLLKSLNAKTHISWMAISVILFLLVSIPSLIRILFLIPDVGIEWFYLLLRHVLSIVVYFAFANIVTTEKLAQRIVVFFYYTAIIAGIWSTLQVVPATHDFGDEITKAISSLFGLQDSYRYSANLVDGEYVNRGIAGYNIPTAFGGYMAVILPLIIFPFLSAHRPRTFIPPYIGLPIAALGLIVSFARHAYLAFALAMIITWVLAYFWSPGVSNRLVIWLSVLLAVVALAVTFGLAEGPVADLFADRAGTLTSVSSITSEKNYTLRVNDGFERFFKGVDKDNSILVWGQSVYLLDLADRKIGTNYEFVGFISNGWVLLVLDAGVPTALTFAGILFGMIFMLGRRLSQLRDRNDWTVSLLIGCFGTLVSLAFAYFGDNYWLTQVYMRSFTFLLLGLSMAALRLTMVDKSLVLRSPN